MSLDTLKTNRPMVLYGSLAGLVPFFASVLATQFGLAGPGPFLVYSAIILAFLSGALWWFALTAEEIAGDVPDESDRSDEPTLALALVLPAVAWLVLVMLPERIIVLLLGLGFLTLWVWEVIKLRQIYSAGYMLLRTVLTAVVLLLHFWLLSIVN